MCVKECQVGDLSDNEIFTNYEMQSTNVGAPVLNNEGYVIGMIVKNSDGVLSVSRIDNIRKMLDTLNVAYLGEKAEKGETK